MTEDEDLVLDGRSVAVERDHSCLRALNWRCRLEHPEVDFGRLAQALVSRGYREASRLPGLIDLGNPDGHQVLFVPSTGRIQIRVHYRTPEAERPRLALLVAQDIADAASIIACPLDLAGAAAGENRDRDGKNNTLVSPIRDSYANHGDGTLRSFR